MRNRRGGAGEDGAVAVLVAVLAVVLFAVGALAVDLGSLYLQRRVTQRTADFAALAGARLLPDAAAARAAALGYLDRHREGLGPLVPGWDRDGDPGNGQIELLSDGGVLDVLDELVAPASGIRVRTPPGRVPFGLAPVFGVSSASVSAQAAAEQRGLGSVLPFGMPDCPRAQPVTLQTAGGGTGCVPAILDIPRQGVAAAAERLTQNVNSGVDHVLGTTTSLRLADCRFDLAGAVTLPGATCLDVRAVPGSQASITQGLVTRGGCRGRLTRVPAGTPSTAALGCPAVSADTLTRHLAAGTALPDVLSGSAPPGSVQSSVVDSPNFFLVPVLAVSTYPLPGMKPVKAFRGFFLETLSVAGGQITALSGSVFPLTALAAADEQPGRVRSVLVQ